MGLLWIFGLLLSLVGLLLTLAGWVVFAVILWVVWRFMETGEFLPQNLLPLL